MLLTANDRGIQVSMITSKSTSVVGIDSNVSIVTRIDGFDIQTKNRLFLTYP
jgi:hypothetical protein